MLSYFYQVKTPALNYWHFLKKKTFVFKHKLKSYELFTDQMWHFVS